MFLVRSAFWLTVAFIAIGPKNVDLGAATTELQQRALAAGQQVIVQQILSTECSSVECIGGKAIVAATMQELPSVGSSMQDSPSDPVPFPRPRPDWMG